MVDINEYTRETTCEYKGEVYSVRDNGSVMRHAREGKKENGKVIHQIGRTYFDERAVLREFCMLRGQEWDDKEEIMDDYC